MMPAAIAIEPLKRAIFNVKLVKMGLRAVAYPNNKEKSKKCYS